MSFLLKRRDGRDIAKKKKVLSRSKSDVWSAYFKYLPINVVVINEYT
jgi:hypothetical protein